MRNRWKHWLGAVLWAIVWWMAPGSVMAREVEVEETSLSLYNKPVTGFRLTIDRSERYVASQVIAHVASVEQASPFQFERSIIYENVRYSPIAQDRDLSLYYLLKSIQGQYTELTLVVMYDYRRSISSTEFPELAQRLKLDLAKLVRALTGDVARFGETLYDDATIARLDQGQSIPEPPKSKDQPDKFKMEELADDSRMPLNDPFKTAHPESNPNRGSNPDSSVQRLSSRIQELEAREQELMTTERNLRNEQATLQRQHDILVSKLKNHKKLEDSVAMLNDRIEAMIGHAYMADDVSVSNETASEMAELEKENRRLSRLQAQLQSENDSLSQVARAYNEQLTRLATGGKTTAEQLAQLTRENKELREEVQAFKTREALAGGASSPDSERARAVADSLLDLLAGAQVKYASLQSEHESQSRNLGRMKEENDFLGSKKMQLEERISTLEMENRTLRDGNAEMVASLPDEQLIDSLNGEIRTARRAAGTAKTELAQVRTDMETLQRAKDTQERQLVAAQSEQQRLQARIAALEAQSGNSNPSRTAPETNTVLADSIRLLRSQLRLAEARSADASTQSAALLKAQTDLATRERELKTLQSQLSTKATELEEAQKAKASLKKSLDATEARLADNNSASSDAQQALEKLRQENKALTNSNSTKEAQAAKLTADNQRLGDSLAANRAAMSSLRKDIAAREAVMQSQSVLRDSLQSQLISSVGREKDLKRNVAILQARVDSLARIRVPEGEQARFLKEQRTKLEQMEKDLSTRDQASSDKEKLLAQRESVLQRREADNQAQEDRFKDLEERERQVLLREQQLNNREGIAVGDNGTPIQVREGRVVEFGNQVPVFIVESGMSYKTALRQVASYMLSRDELYDDRFPELLYRSSNLPELDSQPVEVKVRIDSRGGGSILQISFKLSTGEYLGGENYRERINPAKQLIGKMLRFKI